MDNDTTADFDAYSVAVWIAARYDVSSVKISQGAKPTVSVSLPHAAAVDLLAQLGDAARVVSSGPVDATIVLPNALISVSTSIPVRVLVRLTTRVMLELNEKVGGNLIDIMARRAPLPDDLRKETDFFQIDDFWHGNLDGLVVVPWVLEACDDLALDDPIELAPEREAVADRMLKLVADAGISLDAPVSVDHYGFMEQIGDLVAVAGAGTADLLTLPAAPDMGPAVRTAPLRTTTTLPTSNEISGP